jgi:hypothetical protein
VIHPILICSDKSGAGKDYCANKIVQVLARKGKLTRQHRIADALKTFCRRNFNGVLDDDEYENHRELRKVSIEGLNVDNVVDLWIKVGECFRTIDNTYWIRECVSSIIKKTGSLDNCIPVISDFRFDGEHQYFVSLSREFCTVPIVIQVVCPADRGIVNASDGKVTIPPDYQIITFQSHTDTQIEEVCSSIIDSRGL